jgi:hypothetical protein
MSPLCTMSLQRERYQGTRLLEKRPAAVFRTVGLGAPLRFRRQKAWFLRGRLVRLRPRCTRKFDKRLVGVRPWSVCRSALTVPIPSFQTYA